MKNIPIVVIVVGVALAAGGAYMMKQSATPPPTPPVNSPQASNPGGGHVRGRADAKLTLVEFGDFQCPSCGSSHHVVNALLEDSPGLVKLEFHHYPLIQIHTHAFAAAVAAEAAADQGKYWEMHDRLFERQRIWSAHANAADDFLTMAREIGLDEKKFQESVRAPETSARVGEDVKRGVDAKVQGTPTFFINGEALAQIPQSIQEFRQALQERGGVPVAKD